jgi:outer membrane protein TolC
MGVSRKFVWLVATVAVLVLSFGLSAVSAQQTEFSLDDCIKAALDHNANVISKKNQVKAAKWNVWEAWGNVLPSVSTSANYSFSKTFGPQFIQLPDTAYIGTDPGSKRYSTGLGVNFTIFDAGATWLNIRNAGLAKGSAERDYNSTVADIAYNTKIAYYTLLTANMLLSVQQDALKRSEKQLEVVSSRYELGSASQSEKLKAEVTVANDSLTLLQRENDISVAEFNLNVLLNRDVSLPIKATDQLEPVTLEKTMDDYVNASMESNPGLQKLRLDLQAAKNSVWLARQIWLPRVTASLGWGWNPVGSDDWFSYKYEDGSYRFGVSISYNLFDAFKKKTQPAKAKLTAMSLYESLNQQENTLKANVHEAYLNFQKSRLQLEVSKLAERSAQEDFRLQQERYRLGASSILELLDSQVSLTNAQYSRVQALFQLNQAAANIARSLGQK